MARGKKAPQLPKAEESTVAAPDSLENYTPTLGGEAVVAQLEDDLAMVHADAALVAHNKAIGARPLAEARGHAEQAPNLVGPAVDINAVLAKHLQATPSDQGSDKVKISRSSVIRPVKLVHAIASDMYAKNPEMQRKDVIAACEAAGIATHTARTQYQIWHQAMKSDIATKAALASAPPRTVTEALSRALDKNRTDRKKQK